MKQLYRLILICASLVVTSTAWSATSTTTFGVSGTVTPTCSVAAAALNFGTTIPTPVASNVDATSNITVTCANGAPHTLALNVGTGAGATFAARRMTSGANAMNYSLYSDAGRTTVWGDGTGGSSVQSGTGTGVAQTVTVYGRIASGQTPPTGTYNDTITVTITF